MRICPIFNDGVAWLVPWFRGALSPEEAFVSEVIGSVRGILGLKAERVDGFALWIEWSWLAWVRQVTYALLPRADVLTPVDNDHPDARFSVRWGDALRLAGAALDEKAGYDPPRWRHPADQTTTPWHLGFPSLPIMAVTGRPRWLRMWVAAGR